MHKIHTPEIIMAAAFVFYKYKINYIYYVNIILLILCKSVFGCGIKAINS